MKEFKLFGPDEEYFGVKLEFHAGFSWREIWIDKLKNGQWSMDILVYGEYEEDIRFDTLDELIDSLVNTWYMDKLNDILVETLIALQNKELIMIKEKDNMRIMVYRINNDTKISKVGSILLKGFNDKYLSLIHI